MGNKVVFMKTTLRSLWTSAVLLLVTTAGAHAHIIPGDMHGFGSGFAHPLHGLDHIFVMVAVGLWAAQLGGRARWLVPASFVGAMALGGALAMAGLRVPFTEEWILLSVLVLGILVAVAARFPLAAGMVIVGLFAFFHGHSHGMEMPVSAVGYAYGVGFVLATALLHGCGIGMGLLAQQFARVPMIRFAGAAIAVAGVCLWAF
jgi:urease accessory protein